jgi:microsomal dipeptidase-like Zn-dependent dipeptidase
MSLARARWGASLSSLSLLSLCSLLSLLPAACDEPIVRLDPPPDDGVFGYANGCYAVEGFDGRARPAHLAATGPEGFAFSARTVDAASRFRMRPTDLGTYLFYDQERRYLVAEADGAGTWRLTRAETLESPLTVLDATFRSPAEWQLEPSPRDGRRYQLKHYASGLYLTLGGLTADVGAAAIVTMFPQEGCAEFPELTLDAAVDASAPARRAWDDGDLFGIAEVHSHMMTHVSFGGGSTFHGAPFHRLGVEHALPDCSPWHGAEGRRDVVGFFFDGDSSSLDADALAPILLSGEVPEFNHFTAGYPDFVAWPKSWASSTHQTMYYRWLERAHLAGLRLLVQHATGNSVLCDLVTGIGSQKALYSCNDMESVDLAIAETRALERYVDAQAGGPGKGWLRIVESPEEARAVIAEGKLAIVLGIEISNLFDCFLTPREGFAPCTPESVEEKLDRYHDLGVRVVFPVHKFDNAFTAGDGSDGIIELGNFINSGHYSDLRTDCPGPSAAFDSGGVTFGGLNQPRDVYDAPAPHDMSGFGASPLSTMLPFLSEIEEPPLEGEHCQHHGMTPLGEALIEGLMARGMMIDVAHLPQRSLGRAYELVEANEYPVLKTHGNTNGGRVYLHGGLAGSGLGRCASASNPGGMGASLAASVAEVVAMGGYPAEGLGFDFNGFAHGPRPRFGPDSPCSEPQGNPISYPFTSYDGTTTFEEPHLGSRVVDFNTEGMIHIGLLPELIEDVRRDGVTDDELEPLFRSAEAYVRMWERAEARAKALGR